MDGGFISEKKDNHHWGDEMRKAFNKGLEKDDWIDKIVKSFNKNRKKKIKTI